MIQQTFPGGHTALVDTIIEAKQRFDSLNTFYAQLAPTYDAATGHTQLVTVWKEIVAKNDFCGKVLDLGCGTGLLGNLIRARFPSSDLIGVDICPEMADRALAYSKVVLGRIENVIMNPELVTESFHHILAVGVVQFLEPNHFRGVLARSFDLAGESVTLTIEKVGLTYKKKALLANPAHVIFNHYDAMKHFVPPKDWKLVWKRKDYLWTSPTTRENVSGLTLRFEKIKSERDDCGALVAGG